MCHKAFINVCTKKLLAYILLNSYAITLSFNLLHGSLYEFSAIMIWYAYYYVLDIRFRV
jgi:molybdopterin/thiamine biosynthesis adenylyltransferase